MADKDDEAEFEAEMGRMLPIANALNTWIGRLYAQRQPDLVFRSCMLTLGWHARYCEMPREDFLVMAGEVYDLAGSLVTVDKGTGDGGKVMN